MLEGDHLPPGCGSLQAVWYYCQPPLASLQLLASICSEAAVGKLRGSALLNLLHHRSGSVAGDGPAHRLLHKLLHAAFTPYFRYPKYLHMVSAATSHAGSRLCLMIVKGRA